MSDTLVVIVIFTLAVLILGIYSLARNGKS